MIYLASPYSHGAPSVRIAWFRAACRAAAALTRAGHAVFSPVMLGHPLVKYGLPSGWNFWEPFDREHIRRCDQVVVLTLDGWKASRGVQAEIRWAGFYRKPVQYLSPEELFLDITSPDDATEAEC